VTKRRDPDPINSLILSDRIRIQEENRLKQTNLTLDSHMANLKLSPQKRSVSSIKFNTEGNDKNFSPRISKACKTPQTEKMNRSKVA